MGAIAERLVDRAAAAAEREGRLSGEVVAIAAGIHQLDGALGRLHAIRAVGTDGDFHLRHDLCLRLTVYYFSLRSFSRSPSASSGSRPVAQLSTRSFTAWLSHALSSKL